VIVSESFDTPTADKLRMAMRNSTGAAQAENTSQQEIGLRLLSIPAFQEFEERVGEAVAEEITERARMSSQPSISNFKSH
jgi:hypothetical protein